MLANVIELNRKEEYKDWHFDDEVGATSKLRPMVNIVCTLHVNAFGGRAMISILLTLC